MTAARRLYHVSRRTIFAPFNFDYESSRVTRVSARDGALRAAAIAGGNLRCSPLVSLLCARAEVKDLQTCPILNTLLFLHFMYMYMYNLSNVEIVLIETKARYQTLNGFIFLSHFYIFLIIFLFSRHGIWFNYTLYYIIMSFNILKLYLYKSFREKYEFLDLYQKYYTIF